MKNFEIDISKPEAEFKEHLALEGNQRIIFSAPFGSGKTYFLKKYFGEINPSVFHLYPVNYSVSRNEDIFELIKYDLLFLLLDPERGVDFEKLEFSLSERASLGLNSETANKLLTNFLGFVPKVGKIASAAYENIPKLVEVISPKQLKDEKRQAKKAISEVKNSKGSAKEFNDLSELIRDLISRTKKDDPEQKSILIIDDLDRIDPEHIFRLLNVFAAHFDINEDENKFGFDQVIFVCDIDNIRKIFATKYGQDADFSGYIDKFYSSQVFVFNNSSMVAQYIDQILIKTKVYKPEKNKFFIHQTGRVDVKLLKDVLMMLVRSNSISLRSLLKFTVQFYPYAEYEVQFGEKCLNNTQLDTFLLFEFLHKLFGNTEALLNGLLKVKNEKYFNKNIGRLFIIIDWENHRFWPSDKHYRYDYLNVTYHYKVIRGSNFDEYFSAQPSTPHVNGELVKEADNISCPELFYLAAKTLIELKNLK